MSSWGDLLRTSLRRWTLVPLLSLWADYRLALWLTLWTHSLSAVKLVFEMTKSYSRALVCKHLSPGWGGAKDKWGSFTKTQVQVCKSKERSKLQLPIKIQSHSIKVCCCGSFSQLKLIVFSFLPTLATSPAWYQQNWDNTNIIKTSGHDMNMYWQNCRLH